MFDKKEEVKSLWFWELVILWSVVLATLLTLVATYFIVDYKVKSAILSSEYEKSWWKENYELLVKLNTQQLSAIRSEYWDDIPTAGGNQVNQDNSDWWDSLLKMDLSKVEKIKEGTYIMWNPDAKVSFVEYSDLECPFCKRLHQSWVIENILNAYWDDVNFIFKHFPLDSIHPMAAMEAEALECVWEIGWSSKYYEFIEKVFETSATNGRSFDEWTISDLAWTIWIDRDSVLSCINSNKYSDKVAANMSEWSSLWVTWTPWNILINNETWDYSLLPWAYPFDNFKTVIDTLLNK